MRRALQPPFAVGALALLVFIWWAGKGTGYAPVTWYAGGIGWVLLGVLAEGAVQRTGRLYRATESTVFERREGRTGETNEDAVARLRELGVRIAIDDFGTGYSSLSYLKRWRVDYLKIDRSFVRDLVTDVSDLAIVSAIIAMAGHLNIRVVAEGIEGWQQLEKLRQLGCDLAQGYLFARPVPHAECARFLTGAPLDLIDDSGARTMDFGATTTDIRVAG